MAFTGEHFHNYTNCYKQVVLWLLVMLFGTVSFSQENDLTQKVVTLEDRLKQGTAKKSYQVVYEEAEALLKVAEENKDHDNIVRINILLADLFLVRGSRPKLAEKYLFDASKHVSKCKQEGIITKFRYIFSKQNFLSGNFKGAKRHLYELIGFLSEKDSDMARLKTASCYHAIGTVWEEEMEWDSARIYYHKSIDLYTELTDEKSWLINPKHQLINIDIQEKNFDADIVERIDSLIDLSMELNVYENLVRLQTLKAQYYLGVNDHESSILSLKEASGTLDSIDFIESRMKVFELYFKNYKEQRNHERALHYFEQYAFLKDSMSRVDQESQYSTTQLMLRNTEVENQMYKMEIHNQQIGEERKALFFYLLVAVLLVVLVAIILVIVRVKNKKYRALSEVNLELKTKELKYKENELGTLATDIIRRTSFMKEMHEELKKIRSQPDAEKLKEAISTLLIRVNSQNYINKQLVEIQSKVEDINNNYYLKLEEICPDLTNADKQLCSMIKLNLSQSELAVIFGIETTSLKTKKYRLKKKLKLSSEEDLDQYLRSL